MSRLSLAVREAFKQLLKNIGSEPTLVIGLDDGETNLTDEVTTDIRAWLFNRGVHNGYSDIRTHNQRETG